MPAPGRLRRRTTVALAAAAAAALAATLPAGSGTAASSGPTIDIQMLAFNDFHGNLESGGFMPTGYELNANGTAKLDKNNRPIAVGEQAGGVAYLASNLAKARAGQPYSVTVAAGDLIGASPLISAAFHDEPTIEALNQVGLEVSSVGNHEFDEGGTELQRMQNGGCIEDGPTGQNNQNSCPPGHPFAGAKFHYLAANVVRKDTGQTLLAPYWVKNFKGAKIGFIGMTLKGTPDIVTKAGVAGLEFTDEAATANKYVPILRAQGVKAIVVLLHQGATAPYTVGSDKVPAAAPAGWTCDKNGPLDPTSAVIPIAEQLDPAIDVVVTGHTHQPYVCDIPDPAGQSRLVTSASSFGRLFTDIRLTYDRRTQDIVRSGVTGSNKVVSRLVAPNPSLENLVNEYRTLVAPIANRRIGKITETLPKSGGPSKETPLGDLIADAQAADPSIAGGGPVDVAFMNPGGIRDDLKFPENTADGDAEGDGVVTFAEAFAVQPFNNFVASMDLTGAQILQLLNEQFTGKNAGSANWKFLQVSDGFSYSWRMVGDAPAIDQTSVRIKGVPLVTDRTYRVAANNFLSDGGDSFGTFVAGGNKIVGGLDIDAFANYLEAYTAAHGAWAPPATARITLLP